MPTQLTPYAAARVRQWVLQLTTDDTAPAWSPTLGRSTPESLRTAAWWLVERGHAPDLDHHMVCILLALYIADRSDEEGHGREGEVLPRDAA
jgi:hypothetical protein